MEEVRHCHIQGVEPQLHPGARPPARPERYELEVAPLVIRDPFPQEPRRLEGTRILPRVLIPADGPRVYHNPGFLGDVVPSDDGVLSGLVEEEGDGRVEPEEFFQAAFEVGELVEVALLDFPVEADDVAELLLDPLEVRWRFH